MPERPCTTGVCPYQCVYSVLCMLPSQASHRSHSRREDVCIWLRALLSYVRVPREASYGCVLFCGYPIQPSIIRLKTPNPKMFKFLQLFEATEI